ncbi:hypothetical protein HY750_00915 [Candidatus Kuenenbacteria bacterium]|nr:hypothetical protein [Candidatus Kuenenbacteria bacterium]
MKELFNEIISKIPLDKIHTKGVNPEYIRAHATTVWVFEIYRMLGEIFK